MKPILTITLCIFLASCGDSPKKEADGNTPKSDEFKSIPGLTAATIHEDLTKQGFELEKNLGAESGTWTCSKMDEDKIYTVKIWGKAADKIGSVNATVTYPKAGPDVKFFLGSIASTHYTGSMEPDAMAWALNNFDKGADTMIGTVRFQIIAATPTARTLMMHAH